MGFKSTDKLGYADPSINRAGRPARDPSRKNAMTFKDLGRDELLKLYRKIKPHSKDAVNIVVELMNRNESSEGTKIKAAALILRHYKDLVKEIYNSDEFLDPEAKELQEPAAVFSLKVINGGKESTPTDNN